MKNLDQLPNDATNEDGPDEESEIDDALEDAWLDHLDRAADGWPGPEDDDADSEELTVARRPA